MPATAITPAAAILVHSQINVDTAIGIQHAEAGLIINGLDITPTREAKKKMDHKARRVMTLHTTPEFSIKLDAEVTLLSGLMSAPHPASTLSLSEVANFYDAVAHGFPTDEGYFTVEDTGLKGTQGDLWKTSPTLNLHYLPTDSTQVVRAA